MIQLTFQELINTYLLAGLACWFFYHVGHQNGYDKGKEKMRAKVNDCINNEDAEELNKCLGR